MISAHLAAELTESLLFFPVFLIIITVSNYCEALAARRCGDRTAEYEGLLTLNPAVHMDLPKVALFIVGLTFVQAITSLPRIMFIIPFILIIRLFFRGIPIDRSRFYHDPKSLALIAAAGPIGVLITHLVGMYGAALTLLAGIPVSVSKILMIFFNILTSWSIFFAWINMLPMITPNGSAILHYLIPSSQDLTEKLEPYSLPIFLAIAFMPPLSMLFIFLPCTLIRTVLSFFVFI